MWIHDIVRPVYDPQENAIAIQGIMIDITQRKTAEQVLSLENRLLSMIANNEAINAILDAINPGLEDINFVQVTGLRGHGPLRTYWIEALQQLTVSPCLSETGQNYRLCRRRETLSLIRDRVTECRGSPCFAHVSIIYSAGFL